MLDDVDLDKPIIHMVHEIFGLFDKLLEGLLRMVNKEPHELRRLKCYLSHIFYKN